MRNMVKPPPKAPSKLEETVDIAEWPRNRKGQAIRVALRPYNGFPLIDIRTWWTGDDKIQHPGKGVSLPLSNLPQLATAIAKALERAKALGLFGSEGTE
jgi:hypothetical protein